MNEISETTRRVLFVLTIIVTVVTVAMLGGDAIAGSMMAWAQILLAGTLAAGLLHASIEARRAGERRSADLFLRWAVTATAILAMSHLRAEDQRLRDCTPANLPDLSP